MKSIFIRIYTGCKKGLLTPNLPAEIIELQKHPLIRILRVSGGLSFLCIFSKSYLYLPMSSFFLIIFVVIGSLLTIYHFYLSYHRIKYIIKLLKSDELDIRN